MCVYARCANGSACRLEWTDYLWYLQCTSYNAEGTVAALPVFNVHDEVSETGRAM